MISRRLLGRGPDDVQERDDVWESSDSVHVRAFDNEPHQYLTISFAVAGTDYCGLTSVGGQIVRRLNSFRTMRSLHLVPSKVFHQLLEVRRKVTAPDVHDVLLSVGVIQDIFRQSLGGGIRWVELDWSTRDT